MQPRIFQDFTSSRNTVLSQHAIKKNRALKCKNWRSSSQTMLYRQACKIIARQDASGAYTQQIVCYSLQILVLCFAGILAFLAFTPKSRWMLGSPLSRSDLSSVTAPEISIFSHPKYTTVLTLPALRALQKFWALEGFSPLQAVHDKGGIFFMQLWHVGRSSHNGKSLVDHVL